MQDFTHLVCIFYGALSYICNIGSGKKEKRTEEETKPHTERESNLIIVQTFCRKRSFSVCMPFLGWTVTETSIMKCCRRGTESAYEFSNFTQRPIHTRDAAIGIIISHQFSLSQCFVYTIPFAVLLFLLSAFGRHIDTHILETILYMLFNWTSSFGIEILSKYFQISFRSSVFLFHLRAHTSHRQ